jgi:Ras-related protein Rab-1A
MILVGEVGAGKSSIINRLADDSFKESYISTIGVDFKFK